MERQNYLGIYFSKNRAAVVCLRLSGRERILQGSFSVSIETQEQGMHALATLIAQGCAQRKIHFSEAALALDCSMFMQHDVHSELNDPRQIAATVRFDTEESLATDITNLALAFQINSSDEKGSELTVFTAERKFVSDVLISLQNNNIDPVTLEPDINCLSRFIRYSVPLPPSQQHRTLFAILSKGRGYFVGLSRSRRPDPMRTFLVGPAQDRQELLQRQVLTTVGLAVADHAVDRLRIFDSTASIRCEQVAAKLGTEVDTVDLAGSAGIKPKALADCGDPVEFAIAYGAALAHSDKAETIDFRSDFMPYQGRKVRLRSALKFLSISVAVLLLAVGFYGQVKLFKENDQHNRLWQKLAEQYAAVIPGQKLQAGDDPVRKLESDFRRIKNVRSGQLSTTGEESVSAKLTLVLEAFNKCPAEIDLKIHTINVTTKSIFISGETSSRTNTGRFFGALRDSGLKVLTPNFGSTKAGRDGFSITVEP